MNYPIEAQAKGALMPSYTERLKEQKARLESQLAAINDTLNKLETNPEVRDVVDSIVKLGGLGF